ncbi:MAG: hypothetical protein LBQ32_05770 [Burkholderiaceae bacterium]|nr:hypothetical protein [Burkholderiaceae bacterium]
MFVDDAPSVIHPVGRTPRLAWSLAGLWLAGVAAVFGALFSAPALIQHVFFAVLLAASVLLSGGACLAFWRSQRARQLLWDGERWSLAPDGGSGSGEAARPRVRIDLQRALLLSLESPLLRRPIWLWAEAGHDLARWHLLRCALYSSQPCAAEWAVNERAATAAAPFPVPSGRAMD